MRFSRATAVACWVLAVAMIGAAWQGPPARALEPQPSSVDTLGATAGSSSSAENTVGQANRGTRNFRLVGVLGGSPAKPAATGGGAGQGGCPAFRPPAVPLVTSDPYLSIWSEADRLTDDATRHWTRREHRLVSLIRIDGRVCRLMGNDPRAVPAMPQVGLQVLPTRSIYDFDDSHVHVTLTFMTTALPDDLDVLARPLSYITWEVRSVDGAEHKVSLLDGTSSQLAVNKPEQKVEWGRLTAGPLLALRVGTQEQPLLETMGDDVRIDWGYAYAVAPADEVHSAIGALKAIIDRFVAQGDLPAADDQRMPRAVSDAEPLMAFQFDLGCVGRLPVSRHVMVAYDEIYAIKFFGRKLRPYWRRGDRPKGTVPFSACPGGQADENWDSPRKLFQAAERDYAQLTTRCEKFDCELMADMTRVGGPRYAQICALAYRQCLAATGLAADAAGQPLLFTKENTSNGDIATVDVIFPMGPIFVWLSPTLAKASLVPVLQYSVSDHWKFRCAPHDLGTYPVCMGRDDGGEAMPVEESGNMLILCDAIAKAEGNADFVTPWWPLLTRWAGFLEQFGLDPENQLCTDDFMGHLAHNANLSVKAVVALAAYGDLCRRRGDAAGARRYAKLVKADSEHWLKAAADGDHSRLAFDKPGTWSQKYNLVWDQILGLKAFPPSVARQEIAYYKKVMQPFGVPLDSRTRLTKTDWSIWSATMAEEPADFQALISPIYDYLNRTTARSPLVDSYVTDNAASDGMHARPVIGGVFIKMLTDEAVWQKWAARDRAKVGPWAPLPKPPTVTEVVPSSQHRPQQWRYTFQRPPAGWQEPDFDAAGWRQGPGGFGTAGTPGAVVGTTWNTDDIWLRREFVMPAGKHPHLQFLVYHDEDVEIYVDGVLAAKEPGFLSAYQPLEIRPAAKALLVPGARITLAVHCHQTTGGQGVDVGVIDVSETNE
ncbi:MAG: DUF4965 domain-containing protein [Thermoguttaceae bacterium]